MTLDECYTKILELLREMPNTIDDDNVHIADMHMATICDHLVGISFLISNIIEEQVEAVTEDPVTNVTDIEDYRRKMN